MNDFANQHGYLFSLPLSRLLLNNDFKGDKTADGNVLAILVGSGPNGALLFELQPDVNLRENQLIDGSTRKTNDSWKLDYMQRAGSWPSVFVSVHDSRYVKQVGGRVDTGYFREKFEHKIGDFVEFGSYDLRVIGRGRDTDGEPFYLLECLPGVAAVNTFGGIKAGPMGERCCVGDYPDDTQTTYVFQRNVSRSTRQNEIPETVENKDVQMNKQTFSAMIKSDAEEAAYRTAALQISKGARKMLVSLLSEQGLDRSTIKAITKILETDWGIAAVSALLGIALTYAPHLNEDPRVQVLAKEFRIQGMSTGMNQVVDGLVEKFAPLVLAAVSKIPTPPAEKLRIAEKEAKTSAAMHAEQEAEAVEEHVAKVTKAA